uniref:CDP-glucose 4,6-dehydratase n=2 Tax=Bacteria TaxID=2 RepID=A0A7C9KBB0_9BACT
MPTKEYWSGRRVLVTGHTGFKGSWMCEVLLGLGAKVYGYALDPEPNSLFDEADLSCRTNTFIGDVRHTGHLMEAFNTARPEVVIHMAAQPLVRDGYDRPAYTYDVNVMGTVNVLEGCRVRHPKSVVNVTTDKVYRNDEVSGYRYREGDPLDGFDPYSNSKSCSELVTATYKRCYFDKVGIPVSCMRSGNVIGPGDWAADRIVPDLVRSFVDGRTCELRNPSSTRPYQHVLEPVCAYLAFAEAQALHPELAGEYNVGPDEESCVTTGELAMALCEDWGDGARWASVPQPNAPREAGFLALDASKLKSVLGWRPRWNIEEVVAKTAEGYKELCAGVPAADVMGKQIEEYFGGVGRS